ncbi:MAG: outer membrane lipoprotein LolB [Zoogloeaceae bacterium]|nr:outer membrane lipoprotein LolB [Zoogloeaceae bacterium]
MALCLAACASLSTDGSIVRAPRKLNQFELAGRLVAWESQSRHYVNLTWRHDGQRDEILLTTPLGQGLAELSRDARGARLLTADRKEVVASDWEELAQRMLGIRLPLKDLPAWLSGQAPEQASGWRVEYLEYQSDAADALPTLIEATRGDIGLRLKVSEWIMAQ